MSKKKTREEKIQSSNKNSTGRITYSYTIQKSSDAIIITNKDIGYQKKELRTIIITASLIFLVNIILYVLLATNVVRLGFLGY